MGDEDHSGLVVEAAELREQLAKVKAVCEKFLEGNRSNAHSAIYAVCHVVGLGDPLGESEKAKQEEGSG